MLLGSKSLRAFRLAGIECRILGSLSFLFFFLRSAHRIPCCLDQNASRLHSRYQCHNIPYKKGFVVYSDVSIIPNDIMPIAINSIFFSES